MKARRTLHMRKHNDFSGVGGGLRRGCILIRNRDGWCWRSWELATHAHATSLLGFLGGVKFLHIERKIPSVVHSHPPSHYIRTHAFLPITWLLMMFVHYTRRFHKSHLLIHTHASPQSYPPPHSPSVVAHWHPWSFCSIPTLMATKWPLECGKINQRMHAHDPCTFYMRKHNDFSGFGGIDF